MSAAHMVEHSLLSGVAAPAIVLAWAGLRLPRLPAGPPLFAWGAFVAAQWAFHLTPLLERSQDSFVLHGAEHLAFLAIGVWFWAPVLGGTLGDPGRSLYLFTAAPAVDLVGVALMVRGDEAAGVAMLAGTLPILVAAIAITWRWLAREHRDTLESEHPPATRLAVGGSASDAQRQNRWGRMRRAGRWVLGAVAAVCAALAVATFASQSGGQVNVGGGPSQPGGPAQEAERPPPDPEQVERGRELFLEGCSSCHGLDARGIDDTAPSLRGAGAAAADFYLSTGRMPLDKPGDEPIRSDPRYPPEDIDAIVAYIGSLGGPPIPDVRPERGRLNEGFELFTEHCAGCHQAVAKGGVVTGAFAPDLGEATPTQVGEAVRVGPYIMPLFGHEQISNSELDSIARYVELTKDPVDEGGWGIGNIGPVPEGMVAWLLALAALLAVARLIGVRGSE